MKRFLKFLLAVTLLAGMGTGMRVDAVAEEGNKHRVKNGELDEPYELEVTANYVGAEAETPVYRVTIDWGDLDFSYRIGGSLDWDTASLAYVNDTYFDWTNRSTSIMVKNDSNRAVNVVATYTPPKETVNGLSVTMENSGVQMRLERGEIDHPDYPLPLEYRVTLSTTLQRPDRTLEGLHPLGSVTVQITDAEVPVE